MKKLFAASLAMMGLAAGAAQAADSAQNDVQLNASVPDTCAFSSAPAFQAGSNTGNYTLTSQNFTNAGPGPLSTVVTAPAGLIDANTAMLNIPSNQYILSNIDAGNNTTTFKLEWNAYCNFAGSKVRVTSVNGALKRQGAAIPTVGTFADGLAEVIRLQWGQTGPSEDAFLTATGTAGSSATGTKVAATNATMVLGVKVSQHLNGTTVYSDYATRPPLLTGSYQDVIRVQFGAI